MSDALLRQWEMLKLIPRDKKITVAQLSEKLKDLGYSVSRRTLERDLDRLSKPFCLEADTRSKPYGWRYAINMKYPGIPSLTSSEALTLVMLEKHLKNVLPVAVVDNLETQFDTARNFFNNEHPDLKLQDWLSKVELVAPGQPLIAPTVDSTIQRTLSKALLQNLQVDMHYLPANASEPRHYPSVHLQGMVQYGVVIYLAVTINDHQDVRLLAMHRVQSVVIKDVPINPLPGFDLKTYIRQGGFGFGEIGKPIHMTLQFFNGAGKHLTETALAMDQTIQIVDQETLILTATVPETAKLVWWLTSFGPDIEILAPDSLRVTIAERHRTAAGYYQNH